MLMHGEVAERYRDFAAFARDDSPTFEAWALAVADDEEVLAWLADLPRLKQQPNLVFAAARWHGAEAPGPYAGLREVMLGDETAVKATIQRRATQTNEVGRLATLVPVLAQVPGPIGLVEVGASAGLCLHPDRYDYAWPPLGSLGGSGGPVLTARATGVMPVPTAYPQIAWRGGVDLNPLDVRDPDAMAWLEVLVWPEQDDRRDRLRAAVEVARRDPAHLEQGDLFDRLPALLEQASAHGTPVVMHSAVAAYLDIEGRERLHDLMTGLVRDGACRWISNEGPGVLPRVTGDLDPGPARFLLALDGVPVAATHGHGQAIEWL